MALSEGLGLPLRKPGFRSAATATIWHSQMHHSRSRGYESGEWPHFRRPLARHTKDVNGVVTRTRASESGSSGESVGNLRVSALGLSEETVKLAAGGIERTLLVFPAVVDQRTAVLMDRGSNKLFGGVLS